MFGNLQSAPGVTIPYTGTLSATNGFLNKETRVAPAAPFNVHASISLTGSPQTISTAITNPDFARLITFANSSQLPSAGTVTINGTDIAGTVIADSWDIGSTAQSTKAFKTVTSIVVPAQSAGGDTMLPSVLNIFGLSKKAIAYIGGSPGDPNTLSLNTTSDIYGRIPNSSITVELYYFTTDTS